MKKCDIGPRELQLLAANLRKISFFKDLSMGELESVLALIHLYEFNAGQVVFKKGQVGDALYVVHEGEVDIFLKSFLGIRFKKVARLGPGEFFGEMALLDQPYRTATAVTAAPCRLFVLLSTNFNNLLRSNASLSRALRSTAAQRQFENSR